MFHVSSVYSFGWDGQSHAVRIHKQGVWISVCAHETEKARVAPTSGPCVRARNGAGADVCLDIRSLTLLWILEMEYATID